MQWDRLLTAQRYGHEQVSPQEIGRSHFHKDNDRIVFCSAFRRLGRKTQVHPLALNDHIHTRLTHSIEVGSVGRTLGIRVGELIADQLPAWVSPHDLGTIFTIEPMINVGTWKIKVLDDGWTAHTLDGKLSAQFEHTIAVTETGVEILTLKEGAKFL
jgi:hypothetical protein